MRIAHISDLHLRHYLPGTAELPDRLSRAMPERFAQALQRIRGLAPDLLIITGDLLDYPFNPLDEPAIQDLGRRDLHLIADHLAELPVPLAMVHGNHDHPALVAEVFGHVSADQVVGNYRIIAFGDDEGPGHVPVRQGESMARFRAALADHASLPQVHVQHYIVWPERNEGYPHTYGAGAAMREAVLAAGHVRLVLSGHYHIGVPLFCDQGTYFATVPGFTTLPHPFALYDLAADGSVSATMYRLA